MLMSAPIHFEYLWAVLPFLAVGMAAAIWGM